MKLSILDQSPVATGRTKQEALDATLELATEADQLGFHRYWVAEHHDMPELSSPSPELMLARMGDRTERIKLGAGAILLPFYQPYKVAEQFHMLSSFFPGRIDLGIGRAPGGSGYTPIALGGNYLQGVREFNDKLSALLYLLNRNVESPGAPYDYVTAAPVPDVPPEPWLLGTSSKSAKLAAQYGLPYAFGAFMSDEKGEDVLRTYREHFLPSPFLSQPKTIVAISAIAAETESEAERLAKSALLLPVLKERGETVHALPEPSRFNDLAFTPQERAKIAKARANMYLGTASTLQKRFEQLGDIYQTDELMVITLTHTYEARLDSYRRLAQAMRKLK